MKQKLEILLNEYYTYYRYTKEEPFLSYELFNDAGGWDSQYCRALRKGIFAQLCQVFGTLDGYDDVPSTIDEMCCQEDRIPGNDMIRHGKLKWDEKIESNLIACAKFSVMATFTHQYAEDNKALDSLINIFIYKRNSSGTIKDIDDTTKEFLDQYDGNCDVVLIQTSLGYLIHQTFYRYMEYSREKKMSYSGMVYLINQKIKACIGYRESIVTF